MIRSLWNGVSGMKSHQISMDVIGNNIANVNTTAYKTGRVHFQDVLSKSIKGNVAGSGISSINPSQIGLGTEVASIDNIFAQSGFLTTDRVTDLAVDGNGFFIVAQCSDPDYYDPEDCTYNYTRDGAFYINDQGYLVNSNGLYVMGVREPDDFEEIYPDDLEPIQVTIFDDYPAEIDSLKIDIDGKIYINGNKDSYWQICLDNYSNPENLTKLGQNLYKVPENTISESLGQPDLEGRGKIRSGKLEMSNVDLTNEMTNMIVTQRGYQSNARVITVSDSLLEELINLKR